MIEVGEKAPDFRAHTSQGHTLSSEDFLGKTPMVLFFFPKAGTAGCDREIAAFNEHLKEFGKNRVQVMGVSRDTPKKMREYAETHGNRFPLLADEGSRIIRDFGVDRENGKANRVTYIIDTQGKVAHVFEKFDPAGHVQEVLETVKRLKEERPEAMNRA